jgi:hypothetical protein
LWAALNATGGNGAIFVGHDHGNAWCCDYNGMDLCYGRHTGYGGYGTWDRRARVVELTLQPGRRPLAVPAAAAAAAAPEPWVTAPVSVTAQTWVRMENGTVNSEHSLITAPWRQRGVSASAGTPAPPDTQRGPLAAR